ncbi:hypothetical protein JCM11641_006486 [Rhodosporidiobolus odoratus]
MDYSHQQPGSDDLPQQPLAYTAGLSLLPDHPFASHARPPRPHPEGIHPHPQQPHQDYLYSVAADPPHASSQQPPTTSWIQPSFPPSTAPMHMLPQPQPQPLSQQHPQSLHYQPKPLPLSAQSHGFTATVRQGNLGNPFDQPLALETASTRNGSDMSKSARVEATEPGVGDQGTRRAVGEGSSGEGGRRSVHFSPANTSSVDPIRIAKRTEAGYRGTGGAAAATVAAAGRGGVSVAALSTAARGDGTSAIVADLAAGVGSRTTEKSCKNCRIRKVKCNRGWPRCDRCAARNEQCSFGTFVPVDVIPTAALEIAMAAIGGEAQQVSGEGVQVADLHARIQTLEAELDLLRAAEPPVNPATQPGAEGVPSGMGVGGSAAVVSPASSGFEHFSRFQTPAAFHPVEGISSAFQAPSSAGVAHPGVVQSSLSETIRSTFVVGAGMGPPGGAGQQTVETFLRGVALGEPELYAPARRISPGVASGLGAGEAFEASRLGEGAPEWRIARSEMSRVLVIHLVQSFFASCCAYLPSFHGWDDRRQWILGNLDNIDPASRVAVAAFCAMGARASPHSALLGIPLSSPSPADSFAYASAAGVRREQACRALHLQAMDLVHLTGITLDATKENLEAMIVMAQMLIFNEVVPRRSRAMIRSALGQFKELQESALPANVVDDRVRHIGLPLLTCDAITSAYARKKPLITNRDISDFFPGFVAPDTKNQNMQTVFQECLRDPVSPDGLLTHKGIWRAAEIVHAWIAQGQRIFARAAAPQAGGPPTTLLNEIKELWALLDEVHEGIRKLQEMLVHLSYLPQGCASDGCTDQHLRFVTRLDKDLIDIFFLIHTLVMANLGLDSLTGEAGQAAYAESDRRVREALKLVAFYSELYITSRDPHMTYHVVWQLEVLPNWTTIVVQRYGEPGGPTSRNLEATDTELDWLVKGLVCASYYHPVAISRLQELQQSRRPAFPAFQPSSAAFPAPVAQFPTMPPQSPFDLPGSAPAYDTTAPQYYTPTPEVGGRGRDWQQPLPAMPPYGFQSGPAVPDLPSYTFQGGQTSPSATKLWGRWDDPQPPR